MKRATTVIFIVFSAVLAYAQRMPQDNWYPAQLYDLDANTNLTAFDGAPVLAGFTASNDILVVGQGTPRGGGGPGFPETYLRRATASGQVSDVSSFSNQIYHVDIGPHGHAVLIDENILLGAGPQMSVIDPASGALLKGPWPVAENSVQVLFPETNRVYVLYGGRVRVYDPDTGVQVLTWTDDAGKPNSGITGARDMVIGPDGHLHIAATPAGGSSIAIMKFTATGTFIELVSPTIGGGIGLMFDRVELGADGLYCLYEYQNSSATIKVADSIGTNLVEISVVGDVETLAEWTPNQMSDLRIDPFGRILVLVYNSQQFKTGVIAYERAFRTQVQPVPNRIPTPRLVSVAQRQGVPLIDVDYVIVDADSTNVTTAAVGFIDGTMDLAHLVPMTALVEGTSANLGAGIVPGQTYRVTWDPSVDTDTNVLDVAISILAKDGSDVLGLHWLTIPGEGGAPALTINRSPITQEEMMPAFYWWIASGHSGLGFLNGILTGVGGSYDGQTLVNGSGVTAAGRAFLFEQLGVREATSNEVLQASQAGHPGLVNRFTPRIRVADHPEKINEYGFDTGTGWPGDSAFVVPLP